MRRRSRVVRATGVLTSLAAVTLGLSAIPATPARAATPVLAIPATPARVADPVPINYQGGDLVISIDDDGVPQATMQQIINTYWPQSVGAPTVGSSGYNPSTWLNTVLTDQYNAVGANAAISPPVPRPPNLTGGTVTVSGSTVTVDIPEATVQQFKGLPLWLAAAIAAVAGAISGILLMAACLVTFVAATAGVLALCSGVSVFAGTMLFYVVYYTLTKTPITLERWGAILSASLVYAAIASVGVWASAWMIRVLPGGWAHLGRRIVAWLRNMGWLGSAAGQVADDVGTELDTIGNGLAAQSLSYAEQSGMAVPASLTGPVTSGFAGKCLDDSGAGMQNNDPVILYTCNGGANQNWTLWSNGMVEMNARCLNVVGDGTAVQTKVILLDCNGQSGQQWEQVGNSLVNPPSGLCLDDPGGTNVDTTQLQIYTCNGSMAQQWRLPPANQPPSNGSSCDFYAFYGTPCVAAYSTVRALYSNYTGPLYQVQRASDGATADIGLLSPGWYANASQQDSFCAGTTCTITKLYDQSPNGNNLAIAAADHGANAAALPITVHGYKAYGVYIAPQTGYRNNSTRGIAVNGQAEGMYMVASGTHVNSGCCFDFGNVETNTMDNGAGHMDAVNLGTSCFAPCTGSGPWVQADLENGVFPGNGSNPANLGNSTPFVTALLKNNGQTTFALKGADATSGVLMKWWEGPLPSGYAPMHQEGAIVMGTGGDNSNWGVGSFFEGVMTRGYPSDAADDAVQANIVAAGYAGNSGGPAGGGLAPPAGTITLPGGKCVDVYGDDTGTNGTVVDVWDCQPNAVDQHWTHNADGSLQTLGRCLGISVAQGVGGTGTGAPGNRTTLWDCNGSGVEKWVQEPDGTLRNPASGLCLYGQPTNGYQLQVVPCNPSDPNQKFSVNGGNPITNIPSGKCIDVYGDDQGTNGAVVDMWDCLQNAADQHWIYNPASQTLSTLGRCLSISTAFGVAGTGTGSPGNRLLLWDCNGSGVEKWVQQPDGTLRNPPSGLCLYGQPSNRYQLQVVGCNPSDPNQQFFVYDAGGSSHLAAPAGTITLPGGKCVDVYGDDTGVDGTVVDVWDCQPTAADQHWTHNANGSLETLGRCLGISVAQGVGGTGLGVPGNRVTLWDCNGSLVEQWVQQPNGTLINPPSGLCLDDPGGNTANGWQLQVWYCLSGVGSQGFSVNGGNPIWHLDASHCLDVYGDDTGVNGAPVDLWGCQQGAADQHWIYNSSSKTLKTLGRCLGISVAQGVGGTGTGAAGNRTTLWDCNGSGVEQWVPRPDGTLLNPPSGLCLDDPGNNTANGWQLQVWQCIDGDPNQQFDVYDPGFALVNPVSGKCVDVYGDDTGVNGTPVDLWDCQRLAADQHWIYTSDGSLQTLSRCLSISVAQGVGGTGTGAPGNRVTLWDCNGSGVEKWVQRVDGTWQNPASGLCLDDPAFNTANGTQLQVWTCNGGSNQKFAARL
jgi:hypothetical protein